MTTNSTGVAVFTFTVEDATSGSGTYVKANESIVAMASTSGSSILPAYTYVNYTVNEKVVKPTSSTYLYVVVGVVVAVIAIVAVAGVFLIRKPKIPKN